MVGLSDDTPHTDDDCDNETNDNSDGDNTGGGGGDEREVSPEYPEVRFSSSQFENNHLQRN